MDRLGPRGLADFDDQPGIEIGFGRGRRAEPHAFVGELHMRRARVGVGIDRDRGDAHLLRRFDDAAGDLAPVRDQDLGEHLLLPR